ncbi:uncharacterized protein LOC124700354 [Lolium rigidum]|uniref:uncharacterized protein LOC124700354 n=1 Tax=Lolium rigidum TaxID=89674 RepID=UPI001F5E0AFC|nr:uncharacterized protein LOC124700354 [Lolium rigidum]
MAPSASMLFPIYHHGPAAVEAPREGGFRFGFRNVLFPTGFLAMMTRRDKAPAAVPEVAAAEVVKQRGLHAGGDRDAEEKAAALGSKFEEAVRLSCWAS